MRIYDHTVGYKLKSDNLWAYKYIRDRDLNFDCHNVKITGRAFSD